MEKSVMVVGLDDSDHSFYALDWTLQHFFSPSPENSVFKLVIVHAKPSPLSAMCIAGPTPFNVGPPLLIGTADVLLHMDMNLNKIAARALERAKEMCTAKSVNDVTLEVIDGDARKVLCEAVEKYHASVLVVGSHGYGAIKRAFLGSVSDFCAHDAQCSVMIVKKPNIKH